MAECGCSITETEYRKCNHINISICYCATHQPLLAKYPDMNVWRTSQYWSPYEDGYSNFFKEPLFRKKQDELGVLVYKTMSEAPTCESDADRKGGHCLGNVVWSPDSFQSMDEERDGYGGSDLLLFNKKGRFIAYTYFKVGDEEPRFWFRGMEHAVLEFDRRVEAGRREQRQRDEEEWARHQHEREAPRQYDHERHEEYSSRSGNRTQTRGSSNRYRDSRTSQGTATYMDNTNYYPGPTTSGQRGSARDYARDTDPRRTHEREYRREHRREHRWK